MFWSLIKVWLFKVHVPSEFFEPEISFQNSFPLIGITSLVALGVSVALEKTKYALPRALFAAVAIVLPLFFIFSFNDATIWHARSSRGLSVPLAAALALCGTWSAYLTMSSRKIMYFMITSLLIVGTVRDLNISKNWGLACNFVKNQLSEQTGCIEISTAILETEIVSRGIRPPTLPLLSYLLVGTRSPSTILFEADSGQSCENLKNRKLVLLSKAENLSGNYFVLPK